MAFKDKAKGRAYLNEWKRERTKRIHPLLRKRMRAEELEAYQQARYAQIEQWLATEKAPKQGAEAPAGAGIPPVGGTPASSEDSASVAVIRRDPYRPAWLPEEAA